MDRPNLPLNQISCVPYAKRTNVHLAFQKQFQRICEPLLHEQPQIHLALAHSLEQKIAQSFQTDEEYTREAHSTLMNLKRQPKYQHSIPPKLSYFQTPSYDVLWCFVLSTQQVLDSFPYVDALQQKIQVERKCDRCRQPFKHDKCLYHYMRPVWMTLDGEKQRRYLCCKGELMNVGCTEGVHVFKEENIGNLDDLIPFRITPEAKKLKKVSSFDLKFTDIPESPTSPLYFFLAIDCEMCYTNLGMELCRISVIDLHQNIVMDELVKTFGEVLDFNERFSGINNLDSAKYNLTEIQDKLFEIMNDDTILLGHGLENDLKALRIIHPTIVDTSILYPHPKVQQN